MLEAGFRESFGLLLEFFIVPQVSYGFFRISHRIQFEDIKLVRFLVISQAINFFELFIKFIFFATF